MDFVSAGKLINQLIHSFIKSLQCSFDTFYTSTKIYTEVKIS